MLCNLFKWTNLDKKTDILGSMGIFLSFYGEHMAVVGQRGMQYIK